MKEHFELILFTSASRTYCEAVINNVIEAETKYFDHKLYKSQCKMLPGQGCIKDLEILLLGWDMKDIVIIDNRSDNYQCQTDNGIPI